MHRLAVLPIVIAIFMTAITASDAHGISIMIVINEVELNPAGEDSSSESVELFNAGSIPVDVGGWTLTTTAGRTSTVTITNSTLIQPGGYFVVESPIQWLENENESVVLQEVNGAIIDTSPTLSDDDNDDRTWQRSPDGGTDWVFGSDTLGHSNTGTTDDPEIIPEPTPEPPVDPPQEPQLPPLVVSPTGPSGNLTIVFIDVGQGSSTLILMPNGKTLLIDGGDRDMSEAVIEALDDRDVTRVDAIVATHPHSDHIGGLIDVINNFEVGKILDSGQIHNTQTFEDFLDAIDSKQVPLASVRQNDTIDLDPSVELTVLNPPATFQDGSEDESKFNDNSIVVKLTYGEFSALFTGDMESGNEQRLIGSMEDDLSVDVLLAGHHGSNTSSTSTFLSATSPDVVIISVGSDNEYGHPHQEVLKRINDTGTLYVLRTDLDGSIVLTTSGSQEYTLQTSRSNKILVVPEFGLVIVIASISLFMIVAIARVRLWMSLRPV